MRNCEVGWGFCCGWEMYRRSRGGAVVRGLCGVFGVQISFSVCEGCWRCSLFELLCCFLCVLGSGLRGAFSGVLCVCVQSCW
jgi:hypothetical protein